MEKAQQFQESHSLQSQELDLFSSSSSTTSASSSLIISPLSYNPPSVPSSPSVPSPSLSPSPLISRQLQAEQQCIIVIPSAVSAIPSTCQLAGPTRYFTKEEAWTSIRESIPHAKTLEHLLKSEGGYQKKASSHKQAVRRQSKKIYLIVSMYALLQGAIFTAVAQSSIFTCADRWGPVGIVGAVTFGTVIAVLDKLRRMGAERQEVKKSERRQSAVYDKIMLLYWRGSLCEIEALEPSHNVYFKDIEAGRMGIFSARGLLVLGFLLGFSALMIVSCTLMLQCPPCRCAGHTQ